MEMEMKNRKAEFECSLCKNDKMISQGFRGIAYAQTIGNTEDFVGSAFVEYTISPDISYDWKKHETRAFRERLRSRGKNVPRIQESALRDELVILPGAAMSAADVVRALRKYIQEVEKNGMWIGYYKEELVLERVDGTLEKVI
jgi:hypothetical protein